MFEREETAFKHPGCGGVIFAYRRRGKQRFKCEKCGRWAEDIAELALGTGEPPSRKAAEDAGEDGNESSKNAGHE